MTDCPTPGLEESTKTNEPTAATPEAESTLAPGTVAAPAGSGASADLPDDSASAPAAPRAATASAESDPTPAPRAAATPVEPGAAPTSAEPAPGVAPAEPAPGSAPAEPAVSGVAPAPATAEPAPAPVSPESAASPVPAALTGPGTAASPEPAAACETPSAGRAFSWSRYLIKAVAVVAALFLFSRVTAVAPGWCLAVVWALASAFLAVGVTYHAVVKKTFKQVGYCRDGLLARVNGGRTVRLFVAFVASALCVAGLMLASSSWDTWEWGAAVVSVPAFLLVYLLLDRLVGKELAPLRRMSRSVWASTWVTAALACAAAVGLIVWQQPELAPTTATQAFLSAENPFASSPSTLMVETGLLTSYADALSAYGFTRLGELSTVGRYIAEVALQASAFLGLAGLLGVCALDWRELRRVFLPLERLGGESVAKAGAIDAAGRVAAHPSLLRAPLAVSVVAPLLLVGAFLASDNALAQLKESGELTLAENTVRDAFGATAYVLDGVYYDQQQAQAVMEQTAAKATALDEEARETLVPLINESFDKQVANVDSYLDWYYSLGADYERLGNLITGTVEEFVADQLTSSLQEGVDDTQLQEALQGYMDQAAELRSDYEEQLAATELVGVPEWMLTATEAVASGFFDGPVEPAQKVLDCGERLGLSAAAGAAGGVAVGKAASSAVESAGEKAAEKAAANAAADAATDAAEKTAAKQATKAAEKSVAKTVASKVAEKAAGKSFFKAIVSRITSMLASRGIGAAAGGAVGTVAGPAGTVAGIAAGAAIGVGVDYAALMIDEAMNRETYKAEIVDAIEEERSELLAQLGEGTE